MTWHHPDKPCAVYRIWSHTKELLYIGCSPAPTGRIQEHIQMKHWATEISMIGLEWFPNKATASAAEVEAIRAEFPKWNIHHNPQMPPRPKNHTLGKGSRKLRAAMSAGAQ